MEDERIKEEFRRRKSRQLTAILVVISLMLIFIWKQTHPGLFFGELSKSSVFRIELGLLVSFICFSVLNWRCPSCKRYLGRDINPRSCRKCGTRFHY